MNTLQRGALSGFLAGLTLGVLAFIDYGPGNALNTPASWFGLGHDSNAKWFGFLFLLVLGTLFGLLFGVLQRRRIPDLGRLLVTGLAMGLAWWVIIALLLGTVINHVSLQFGSFLDAFVRLLLYGLLLGSLYFQFSVRQSSANRPPEGFEKA
jgi:4-amino-4-deoxy-L-arabinose transferase-like glycosyltransferase